jgi:hypothetical protein
MPFSADTFQITASAAPVCGEVGAQRVAMVDAAIATIQNGYDGFVIQGAQAQDNVGVIGYTPLTATTYSNGYSSNTTVYGGQPIIAGSHDQAIVVHMFRAGDPNSAESISARNFLGPDWEQRVAKGFPHTCTGD